MAPNTTSTSTSIATPSCSLILQAPLIHGISDNLLAIVLPTIVYAVAGGFFHLLDVYKLFSQYRIHPSEDELKRNRVTRWQVLQVVVRYHVMQIAIGLILNMGNGPPMVEDKSCNINRIASAISHARGLIPMALAAIGVDAKGLANAIKGTSGGLAQVVAGDYLAGNSEMRNSGFTDLELILAKFVVSVGVPAFQYLLALAVVDTWIYFTHRLCHANKILYRTMHVQHHRLYVSYAYGAVYASWLETIFQDVLSFVMAGEIAQLSARQSMIFGSLATIKTISDHCGYVFPWDPFRLVNDNGAVFHDLHHQSWGMKYNFSTYTVFWDNLLGTTWADKAGAEERYKRVHELTAKRSQESDQKIAVTDRQTEKAVAEGAEL